MNDSHINLDIFFNNPFLDNEHFEEYFKKISQFHYQNCTEFKNLTDIIFKKPEDTFIPVTLFKNLELKSISNNQLFKVLTSSGTSGQNRSQIYICEKTAYLQKKALHAVVENFLGKKRLPMLVFDAENLLNNRKRYNTRIAAVLGFSVFSSNITYALDKDLKLNIVTVKEFLKKFGDQPFLIFGFTFLVWQELIEKTYSDLNFKNGTLIHGGGWKKLENLNISNNQFKTSLKEIYNINKIHNYYGLVEQIGSVFMECDFGYLHAPNFTTVIIKDTAKLEELPEDQTGIIQLKSLLPQSYPGHNILTEDLGKIISGKCGCGIKTQRLEIIGRLPKAEPRGCSDTIQK